jgi:primary-amine oxidase
MPVDIISFWLKPFGFFDQNPSLDAPMTTSSTGSHSHPEHTGR